jgi:hypothetical protein
MRFDSTSSYRKILDTYDRMSDSGLYVLSGNLVLYPVTFPTTGAFTQQQWHQIAFTRDAAGNVSGYVDGYLQFRALDASEAALVSPEQVLTFLADDFGSEQSAGAVARIRLWNEVLSDPRVATLDDNFGDRVFTSGFETF